ncbi:carbon-nitrogen hydrolase family protein [Roseateles sp.]|uniref:carbon-nitrogen hydrolase family protein n=1 Tax=Roseateles sp. TaxID=1971397 RepID=UPI00286B3896|nr:carbon-nitrogen hydrolase family protein [Roseateles sp.]
MTHCIAIAQITMHWTTRENVASIRWAMQLAQAQGAQICGFSELAVTGFHRQIAHEATPALVSSAMNELQTYGAELSLGIAVGAPTFADDGARFISHLLIDERGVTTATIPKQGLTDPEATFFARGSSRPIGTLQGLRCSAVICREVEDLGSVSAELPPGAVDLIFVPGALRQDPEKPRTNPPEYVRNIQRLAQATRAYVVQTNWPNALNRPEESIEGGGSTVASPDGEVLFRLPEQASGIGIFTLGSHHFDWYPQ